MENRRKFERFGSDMIFWIKSSEAEDYEPFDIVNISAGGVLAHTAKPFESGSVVWLNFELPQHTELIDARAVVRHCHLEGEEYHCGLEIIEVANVAQDRLVAYLEELFK